MTTSTVLATHLARAHSTAIAAFRGECEKSYELLSDKQRAELATRQIRLAHKQAARARDGLAALVAQVRSLEDRPELRETKRDLLRTATAALDALATTNESPTVLPTLADERDHNLHERCISCSCNSGPAHAPGNTEQLATEDVENGPTGQGSTRSMSAACYRPTWSFMGARPSGRP